jgi:hypothetical protein
MGRILILLTVGSAFIFMMVVNSPLKTIRNSIFPGNETESIKTPKDPIRKQVSQAKKPVRKATTRSHLAVTRTATVTEPDAQSPEIPFPEGKENVSWATVSSDFAAIYSINFARSTMLQWLKRGEVVQTGPEMVDPDGRWILVKAPDQQTVGYVRSENLTRELPAEASTPIN